MPNKSLEVGDSAPSFRIKNQRNEIVDLFQLRGSNVVLYFYPKDDTPGCTIEAQDFSSMSEEFGLYNCAVIGVSRDDQDSHCKFANKYSLSFDLLSDTEEELCKKYEVLKEKSMFGKKYIGIDRSTFLIDRVGKVTKIWRNVSVKNHAEEVLSYLKKLEKKS